MSRLTKILPVCLVAMLSVLAPLRAAAPTTAPIETALNLKSLAPGQQAVLAVVVDIPEGLHAQSATPTEPSYIPFQITMDENPSLETYAPIYPEGEIHTYELLGRLSVYTGRVIAYVPVQVKDDAPPGPVTITGQVQYQMCDDKACFQPQYPKLTVESTIAPPGTQLEANRPELFQDYKPGTGTPARMTTTTTTAPAVLAAAGGASSEWTIWTALGAALLAGLLFNVMPCVLPVLPLKAAAFHRAAEHHRSRSMLLGAAFSLGIISVFAVLAVLVLVLRVISWGSLFANPVFVWGIVILLVICAFGMFDAFTLQLPTSLYNVDPRQDTFGGNVVFGAFTAILATPCTAPLLPPLLIWASAQPVYVGVPAMLMVGVGMALPYLILSATPELAKRFPRTGPWSELFKQMMGFMLLAAAAYFGAGRVIQGPGFWWVVVAVVAIAALYLMARTVQLTPDARPVGIAAALAVAMLGGTLWWTAKITGLTQPATAGDGATWTSFSDETFHSLRDAGTPVLVKFTANWCGTCQYIEGTVFRDPEVWQSIQSHGVSTVKVDLTTQDAPGKELLLQLNPAGGIPLTALFIPGKPEPIVLDSVYSSGELLNALESVTPLRAASAK